MDNALAYMIPIVAIVGGITYAIFNQHFRTQRRIAETAGPSALLEALSVSQETSTVLRRRMDGLDSRLRALELPTTTPPVFPPRG